MLDWKQISDSLLYMHTKNYLSYKIARSDLLSFDQNGKRDKGNKQQSLGDKGKNWKKKNAQFCAN